MPNSFDNDPRGSTNRRLAVFGVCFAVVAALSAVLMVAKSQGALDDFVRVDIKLVNIGDGLPARSDIKFRGVLVGMVSSVTPSRHGQPNVVHVDIQPQHAARIPNTVTARVVPANVFAVSAVQLVDNPVRAGGAQRELRSGDVIMEDQALPTVLFQNVLAKLRQLLASVGRGPDQNSVGVIAALAEATHGRGEKLTDAGRGLDEVLRQMNSVVSTNGSGPTTLSALKAAADSLRTASPELFDVLDSSVQPMRTFAEQRVQLSDFLTAGLRTTSTLGDAFDHQTDRMIVISYRLTPVVGVLADHANEFHGVSTRLQTLANKFYDEAWNPQTNMISIKAIVALAPSRTYIRADCPRYGAMQGPSCLTAPDVPTAPDLKPGLASMGTAVPPWVTENRPNFAPPRESVRGAPDPPPSPAAPEPAPAQSQAGPVYGGTVGPVGSHTEREQLSRIVGGSATSATELLLGPVARGAVVQIAPEPGAGR